MHTDPPTRSRVALTVPAALVGCVLLACGPTSPSSDPADPAPVSPADAKTSPRSPAAPASDPNDASVEQEAAINLFQARLEQMFHALPPPEALEHAISCPPFVAPKDGSMTVSVIERGLLELLATGRPPLPTSEEQPDGKDSKKTKTKAKARRGDAATPEAPPLARVDALAPLNTPVFMTLRARARERAGEPAPPDVAVDPAALADTIAELMRNERLIVVLGDLKPAPSEEKRFRGGTLRGHVVFYNVASGRPFCFEPYTATTDRKDAPPEQEPATYQQLTERARAAVDAAVDRQIRGLKVRWP
ncbi:MAG: hypothetical protein H6713_25585 [Myxococcales bacterium]|nr:hypothetical protein [Myxococcales bacterium]